MAPVFVLLLPVRAGQQIQRKGNKPVAACLRRIDTDTGPMHTHGVEKGRVAIPDCSKHTPAAV